jgi:predicted glycogen debranching enzyme
MEVDDMKNNLDIFNIKEWLLTNGLGGYSYMSLPLINTSCYQSLMCVALHTPVDRYSVLENVNEEVIIDNNTYLLNEHIVSVDVEDIVTYTFQIKNISIKKEIAYAYDQNTLAISYHITNPGKKLQLFVSPELALRSHHEGNRHKPECMVTSYKDTINIIPLKHKELCISMSLEDSTFIQKETCKSYHYDFGELTGGTVSDKVVIPGTFHISNMESRSYSFICSLDLENSALNANTIIFNEKRRINSLYLGNDRLLKQLYKASDQFIVKRGDSHSIIAGYPWFNDWGRDTLISLEGLTLCTGRFHDAKDILLTFVHHLKDGLCVNMFTDQEPPLYNTVDGSLWLIHACYKYLLYTNDFAFIQSIYPALKTIISHYVTGTKHNIHMSDDFLLFAGSGEDQITWMDVRIHGKAVTPRHGKPVEVNALWYNALKIMNVFAGFTDNDPSYDIIAIKVKENFVKVFFDEQLGYLKDTDTDPTLRPNQLYAFSLPFPVANISIARRAFPIITEKLYVGRGLRSLTPDDPQYIGTYLGPLESRDYAYHQGTSWGYLIGPYIRTFLKLNHSREEALKLLDPLLQSINEQLIGGINEIYDGDAPHTGKGCVNQAWSVAEVLCLYQSLNKMQ